MCVVFAYFFDQLDNNVLGFAAPSIMRSFGIDMATFAPAQSIYFIGMMAGGILGGLVADRIGRRKTFMAGCFCFSVFTFLGGHTHSLGAVRHFSRSDGRVHHGNRSMLRDVHD